MGKIATACGILALVFGVRTVAASESVVIERLCDGTRYEQGLCAFYQGELDSALPILREVAAGEPSPNALRARYFVARVLMRQEKWAEAGRELVRLFGLDPGFYREWGCDFLLGETRRRQGLD